MAFQGQRDPFLEAQEYVPHPPFSLRTRTHLTTPCPSDVLSTLKQTRSLFSSYLRIRSLASSASSPELSQARTELESTIQDLSTDLQDLVDSVKAVEGDPFRYGLDIDEVGRRRKLVKDASDEVEDMRQELKRKFVVGSQKGQGVGGGGAANGSLPPPSAFAAEDDADQDDYGAFEQQRQVEMMHEQDEQLDGVFKTVGNLRQQADDMGRELEEQGEMLDDVHKDADRVGGKLQNGLKRVGWVIKNNEGTFRGSIPTTNMARLIIGWLTSYAPETWSSCCIGVLVLVLILLLVLVLMI